MIARVIRWSLDHPGTVVALSLLLLVAGVVALVHTRVDAIPDLSDLQVIVRTDYPGQPPQVVEDQVTAPLSAALSSLPRTEAVRGFSSFATSYLYVLFDAGTDVDWARARVLEALTQARVLLPDGVRPALGPEASSVGWIYSYALVDRTGRHDLAELRSLQDFVLKPELQRVPGVAEVATVGGMQRQYQVVLDPDLLSVNGFMLEDVVQRIQAAGAASGGSTVEMGEADYIVQANGQLDGVDALRLVVLDATDRGTPLFLDDIARIETGPAPRLGVADLDGIGEVTGGIVVMRLGANALETLAGVHERISALRTTLPTGVELIDTYDRSPLIRGSLHTLARDLLIEMVIVSLVCVIFLLHLRASLVVVISLPLGLLAAVLLMQAQGITANIMSLGGIAVAIGAMVDAAIVSIENVHRHAERAGDAADRDRLIEQALCELGPALFFSLLVIALSFLPLLALEGETGRMFTPLVLTKTYAMAAATLLSVTLVPVLIRTLVRGRLVPESANPVNRLLAAQYAPLLRGALRRPRAVLALAVLVSASALWPGLRLGTEFMPELDEGTLLYMPTTLPALAVGKATQLLQQTDRALMTVPEVARVFGKIGRAETATDPAPLNMIETVVQLRPRAEWRAGLTPQRLRQELNAAVTLPGLTNAWVGPIRGRIDMLATGFRTPVGIKLAGDDLDGIARTTAAIEEVLRRVPGTRSAYAERSTDGRYVMIDIDRARAARYALNMADLREVVTVAIGGMPITSTIEGRARYAVSLRYPRELRDSVDRLRRLPIVTANGSRVTLDAVADVHVARGPDMIRSEDGRLSGWIHIDTETRDVAGYVARARAAIAREIALPPGYTLSWSGQYAQLERAQARLAIIVPAVLFAIVLLLHAYFRRPALVAMVLGGLPLACAGGLWFVYLLDMQLSVAVVVGLIALAGVAVETGVVMLVYLEQAYAEQVAVAARADRALQPADIEHAVIEGALLRLRPKLMTVAAIVGGLLPLLLGQGTGAEVMRPIAAPMVGGMVTATALTLLLIPVLYLLWRRRPLAAAPGCA